MINFSDRVLTHSRLTDGLYSLIDDETANEVYYSKKLSLFSKFVYEEDREYFYNNTRREVILENIKNNRIYDVDFRLKNKDSYLYFQINFAPIFDPSNNVIGFVAGMRNIDNEIRRELGVRKKLEDALMAADAANQAKTSFLFNMSHDIRTPMNAIIGFTDIARKNIDDKNRVLESLNKVKMSGEHLLSLINDILDMSRIESGNSKLNEEIVNIVDEKNNLFSLLNSSAQAKNIKFESIIDSSVKHPWIYADRLFLMRVLTNIVSNSIKYTNQYGNIKMILEELESNKENYARYRYTITDTGIGMSEEFLEHIFDAFSRAESATKSGVIGTGLGMAITKSLVELMGGTIKVESQVDVGTTVIIELENRIAENNTLNKKEEILTSDTKLDGKKVLLVEDNELNREIATEILKAEGMIVFFAEDGDIAVELMKNATVGQYDFILMDIQMPRMNGYDATKAIRALNTEYTSNIPIVAMTAKAFEEDKQNAFNAGMNSHIAKPIDVAILIKTLVNILK